MSERPRQVDYPAAADADARKPRSNEPRSFRAPCLGAITARQAECLYWVFQGKSATDIGGILGISGRVVEEHLQKACAHFGVKSRHQAAWRAQELGLLRDVAP